MFFDEDLIRLHREEILKEAEKSRLIGQIRQQPARRRYRYELAFAWLGIRLSRWGELLQKRFGEVEESTACSQSIHNGI
jgi:hypothetical protein